MRLTGALRQSTIRMPSASTYDRDPMRTSRRRVFAGTWPREPGRGIGRFAAPGSSTSSSRRRWPKYGLARSIEPLTLVPRCARSAPSVCICSKSAGRSSGLATATSSRSSSRCSSSRVLAFPPASAAAARSTAASTVARSFQLFANDAGALGILLEAGHGVGRAGRIRGRMGGGGRAHGKRSLLAGHAPRGRRLRRVSLTSEEELVAEAANGQVHALELRALALDLGLKARLDVVEEGRHLLRAIAELA